MHALPDTLCLANLAQHMLPIEGGVFERGSDESIHTIQLDNFELCRYPVSQQLWYEVMGKTPDELYFQNPHRPVERVSWDDISQEFLPALREKTGIPDYCLPTEAQWEYAARGGKCRTPDYRFSGSEAVKEVAWYDDNSFGETQPTGLKRPNSLGLYDMSGNLWEWCQDWYARDYYESLVDPFGNQPAVNPTGPEHGDRRVVRGGSWYINDHDSRVANRVSNSPLYRYSSLIGFRLCRYSAR